MTETGEAAGADCYEVGGGISEVTVDHRGWFAAVDPDVDGRTGGFESLAGAAGRGVDIDPAIVDGQDGDRKLAGPWQLGQYSGDTVGVR